MLRLWSVRPTQTTIGRSNGLLLWHQTLPRFASTASEGDGSNSSSASRPPPPPGLSRNKGGLNREPGPAREPARLAKPNRYRPPSHFNNEPPRKSAHTPLPRPAYKGERKSYPGTMPSPGTIAHFLLHNKVFHVVTTLGVLILLACYVGIRDFMDGSPYAYLVKWEWKHPIDSIRSFIAAYRADDQSHSVRIMEKRRRRLEDLEKRAHYQLVVEGKVGGEGWGISVRPHPYDEEWGTVRINGKRVVDMIAEAKDKKEKDERRAKGEIVEDDDDTAAAGEVADKPITDTATGTGGASEAGKDKSTAKSRYFSWWRK